MTPLFLTKKFTSMKREVMIVLGVLTVLSLLPIAVVFSITDVGALGDSGTTLYTDTAYPGDKYDYGYCTYWAAMRRLQVGMPIPNDWGDAHTWDDGAELAGYQVDHIPTQNAVMETDAGLLGHVAFVESVGLDGSWTISEMNYKGWDEVDSRTLKASDAKSYNFIHSRQ